MCDFVCTAYCLPNELYTICRCVILFTRLYVYDSDSVYDYDSVCAIAYVDSSLDVLLCVYVHMCINGFVCMFVRAQSYRSMYCRVCV